MLTRCQILSATHPVLLCSFRLQLSTSKMAMVTVLCTGVPVAVRASKTSLAPRKVAVAAQGRASMLGGRPFQAQVFRQQASTPARWVFWAKQFLWHARTASQLCAAVPPLKVVEVCQCADVYMICLRMYEGCGWRQFLLASSQSRCSMRGKLRGGVRSIGEGWRPRLASYSHS